MIAATNRRVPFYNGTWMEFSNVPDTRRRFLLFPSRGDTSVVLIYPDIFLLRTVYLYSSNFFHKSLACLLLGYDNRGFQFTILGDGAEGLEDSAVNREP